MHECDGIWMDKDELKKIEELVDGWKADLNQDAGKFGAVLQKIDVEEQANLTGLFQFPDLVL